MRVRVKVVQSVSVRVRVRVVSALREGGMSRVGWRLQIYNDDEVNYLTYQYLTLPYLTVYSTISTLPSIDRAGKDGSLPPTYEYSTGRVHVGLNDQQSVVLAFNSPYLKVYAANQSVDLQHRIGYGTLEITLTL